MQDKALSLLGIAKKAGLLAIGSEAAAISARQGKARLIITATDASAGSVRRARANAADHGSEYLSSSYTKFEIGNITGRGSPGVIAVLDKGLAMKLKEEIKMAKRTQTTAQELQLSRTDKPPRAESAKESDA